MGKKGSQSAREEGGEKEEAEVGGREECGPYKF